MGRTAAREWILDALAAMLGASTGDRRFKPGKNLGQNQYVFARLPAWAIRALVAADASGEVAPSVTLATAGAAVTLPEQADAARRRRPRQGASGGRPSRHGRHGRSTRSGRISGSSRSFRPPSPPSRPTRRARRSRRRAPTLFGRWSTRVSTPHIRTSRCTTTCSGKWRRGTATSPTTHPSSAQTSAARALTDSYGHGTHVAGIVAGEIRRAPAARR